MNMSRQRGSAIIMIFVAVALFGLLSFAFLRGSNTSTALMSDEQTKIYAQKIIAYGNDMRSAVKRLQLRGCQDKEFSFANKVVKSHGGNPGNPEGHNPKAPASGICDLFKPEGAAMKIENMPDTVTEPWPGIESANSARGSIRFFRSTVPNMGNPDKEEIVLAIPYLNLEVCKKINDLLGIPNPSGNIPKATNSMLTYNGVFTDNGTNYINDDELTFTGKEAFCIRHPTGQPWDSFYIHVLLIR